MEGFVDPVVVKGQRNLEIPFPNHAIPDLRIFTSTLTNKNEPSVGRYTRYTLYMDLYR